MFCEAEQFCLCFINRALLKKKSNTFLFLVWELKIPGGNLNSLFKREEVCNVRRPLLAPAVYENQQVIFICTLEGFEKLDKCSFQTR